MSLSKFLSVVLALCGAMKVVHCFVDVSLQESLIISGADVNGLFGRDVRNIGDFNHDGASDILVSGYKCNERGEDCSGLTYVLFGGTHVSSLDLVNFKSGGIDGFRVFSPYLSARAAPGISGAGDVNGDGFDDIMVQNEERVAVVYGFNSSARPVEDIHLGTFVNSKEGFDIIPPSVVHNDDASELFDVALEGAGDVNGDGIDDILVCYPEMSPFGRHKAGLCYVVFGTAGVRKRVLLDELNSFDVDTSSAINPTNTTSAIAHDIVVPGFRIVGASAGDRIGTTVLANLDLNDDSVADIVISQTLLTYVVFGLKTSAHSVYRDVDLSVYRNPTTVLQIKNLVSHGNCVYTLAAVPDINGDGVNDLAIGCSDTAHHTGPDTGSVTVVYGHAECDPFMSHVNLNAFKEGVEGFSVYGPQEHANFGQSVTNGGDLNGDGRTDLLVGAQGGDGNNVVYVVYSREPNSPSSTNTTASTTTMFSDVDMSVSFATGNITRIVGTKQEDDTRHNSAVGVVRNIGDFNGDGKSDILLSNPRGSGGNSGDRKSAGVIYVMNGLLYL